MCGQLCTKLCEAVSSEQYNLIVVNFANPDMVGHTGSLKAAIAAVEAVDRCVGELVAAVDSRSGTILITAWGTAGRGRRRAAGAGGGQSRLAFYFVGRSC